MIIYLGNLAGVASNTSLVQDLVDILPALKHGEDVNFENITR
jgi:hypothetical protein